MRKSSIVAIGALVAAVASSPAADTWGEEDFGPIDEFHDPAGNNSNSTPAPNTTRGFLKAGEATEPTATGVASTFETTTETSGAEIALTVFMGIIAVCFVYFAFNIKKIQAMAGMASSEAKSGEDVVLNTVSAGTDVSEV